MVFGMSICSALLPTGGALLLKFIRDAPKLMRDGSHVVKDRGKAAERRLVLL